MRSSGSGARSWRRPTPDSHPDRRPTARNAAARARRSDRLATSTRGWRLTLPRECLEYESRVRAGGSEPGVDGLALHRQDPEDTLVDAVQRLVVDEPLECFGAEGELADRE
jgi:hypothetical protein